jgi:SAM-dependent methyltransferase
VSAWVTSNAEWRAWLEEDGLCRPAVAIVDEFDRELRGVLDGMFGPALEATAVSMPVEGFREDSMTTLVRHRDDIVRSAEPPEEFDAASTLVHAPRIDDEAGGFDVTLTTPGGGYEVELAEPQASPPADDAFFIPALTESARIVVAEAPTDAGTTVANASGGTQQVEAAAPEPAAPPSELVAIDTGSTLPPIATPRITVPQGLQADPLAREERPAVRGPIGWAEASPDHPPVRTGTTLIPTENPAASSQTAGVIDSLVDDPPMPPPRRKSKIVVASSDSTTAGVVAEAYDDSGEYPRPVPSLEPGDETELEDDDLDSAEDIDAPLNPPVPKPAAPKPAVRVVTNDAPPPPPKPEPAARTEAHPPPPPRAEAPPLREAPREGPPPLRAEPPPVPRAEPHKGEGPPPPPVRAPEAARLVDAIEPVGPAARAGNDSPTPRVRTLPGVSGPHWSEAVFTEHFFALVRPGGPRIAATEVALLQDALGVGSGSTVIDVGCGDGWHAQLLAERGMRVVGLDSSEAMIKRATELAEQNGVRVRWILGDVRQRPIQETFDGVVCVGTSFGYDDDSTNRNMLAALRDLVRVGGRLALHVVNRDYIVPRLPARSWWQGDRCLVLDEVDMQDWSSRVRVRRTIVFENGGQFEHTLSIRVYALHELVALIEEQGLRVVEVSGSPHTRGRFYGATSPDIWLIAERIDDR